jgi:hypothetical protein
MAKEFVVKAKENCIRFGKGVKTGLVLARGQRLVIKATGTWSLGEGDRTSDANGLGNPQGGKDFGVHTWNSAQYIYGSLVGSVDNGKTFFPVGTRLDMPVLAPGKLSLWCWDSNSADNSGAITATVDVVDLNG